MSETVEIPTYHGPIAAGGPVAGGGSRPCQRPGCSAGADATLTFAYGTRESWIGPLARELTPQAYDLCGPHADRTEPPSGWDLRDRRRTPDGPALVAEAPDADDGPATVDHRVSGRATPPRREAPRHPLRLRERAGARRDPPIEVRARAW